MAAPTNLQTGNPSLGTVSRAPQTTNTPDIKNAPFTRLSRMSARRIAKITGTAFGNPINPVIIAAGGHIMRYRVEIVASGGTAGGTNAVYSTTGQVGPWSVVQNLLFQDPFGTQIFNLDGWSLRMAMAYGCQFGQWGVSDPGSLASAANLATVNAGGNFTLPFYLSFILDSSGYCALPSMNAASLPTLSINFNPLTTVFSTSPGGVAPTLATTIHADYWGAPIMNASLAPPGVGSYAPWSLTVGAQTIPSASQQYTTLQKVGSYIHTLVLTLRDSAGTTQDNWPLADLQLVVDNVPILNETFNARIDKMLTAFNFTRPTGVIVYPFRQSVQDLVNNADTHDVNLYTTPATSLEVGGTFQTIGSAPATVQAVTGELYPSGGVPWTHLAA
jgi:hypothetical protein